VLLDDFVPRRRHVRRGGSGDRFLGDEHLSEPVHDGRMAAVRTDGAGDEGERNRQSVIDALRRRAEIER